MLLVPCPHCGPRNAADLTYRGASVPRPDRKTSSPDAWRDYLYLRDNPSGWLIENWYCASGCRRHFQVERHTLTGELREPVLPGRKPGGRA